MISSLQRLLARIAAITAIALGAILALALAGFTLLAGLVVGLVAMVAAWFGARSLRGPGTGGRSPGGGERRDVTVIDVEMREVDETPADPAARREEPNPADRRER